MVDRLFWRAGFGPTAADRATWIGKPLDDAVDSLLNTPQGALVGPDADARRQGARPDRQRHRSGARAGSTAWCARRNPLVERMTFFWHRHFANSRDGGLADAAADERRTSCSASTPTSPRTPTSRFRDMALEVSKDPSMLRYLNGESNVKGGPNENYARELMELFTLGVNHAITGAKNYTRGRRRSSSRSRSRAGRSTTRTRTTSRRCSTPAAGTTARSRCSASSATTTPTASSTWCSRRTATRPTSSTSCGASSCPRRPRRATLQQLATDYTASGRKIKPLVRSILTQPAAVRVDRRAEHDQAAGRLRASACCARSASASRSAGPADYLDSMGQLPYFPPTVAGWEGGLSWLNTNTALARFGFVGDVIGNAPNGSPAKVVDVPGETPQAAFDRAYGAVGSPWCRAGTRAAIQDYASARLGQGQQATASPARSCCARSCSPAPTHR